MTTASGLGARVDADGATSDRAAPEGVRFTTFAGATDTTGQQRSAASWRHFVGGLQRAIETEARAKVELPAIGPFLLSEGERRVDAGVEVVTLLALDLDGLPAELRGLLARLEPLAAVAHMSPSDGGPEAPTRKLRLYALPSRPISPAECRAARLAFAASLGVTCDRTALNPSRILFAGRIAGTAPRELWAFDGEPVDVDALLATAPPEVASQAFTGALSAAAGELAPSAIEIAQSCVLGRALLASKAVLGVRVTGRGATAIIRCPNAAAHDRHGARTTDETALYLPPRHAGGIGAISCMRSACAGIRDWLPFFDDGTIEAAGIQIVSVRDVYRNSDNAGRLRLGVRLVGADLREQYLRCSEGTGAWRALFAAAHTEIGSDPRGLIGAWIGIALDSGGRVERVYPVEEAPLPETMLGAAE